MGTYIEKKKEGIGPLFLPSSVLTKWSLPLYIEFEVIIANLSKGRDAKPRV